MTVSQIAAKVGLSHPEMYIDATELKDESEIEYACDKYTVFGRVTPEQKKLLVLALQKKKHNVAMTGDGVNDIPAMKAADCSIAMATGSDAAKNAAQITLLSNDFSVMPEIVLEGRRVINNITRSASLFLTKTLFSFILSLLTFFMGNYPFIPIQLTLISALTVGVPSFFLALEPSKERIHSDFLPTVIRRALPGALAISLCCASVMMLENYTGYEKVGSTIATIIAGVVGFVVLLRASSPFSFIRFIVFTFCLGSFLDESDAARNGLHVFRVDDINISFVVSVIKQSGGWVDVERSAHNDENVGLFHFADSVFHQRNGFAKPHDKGAHHAAVGGVCAVLDRGIADVLHATFATVAANFGQFAMKMDYVGRTCAFMQIVNVLRYNRNLEMFLQFRCQNVCLIGLCLLQFSAACIIELNHEFGIAVPAFDAGHIFHIIIFPQSVAVAESADTALGTDAGAGQKDDFLHDVCLLSVVSYQLSWLAMHPRNML